MPRIAIETGPAAILGGEGIKACCLSVANDKFLFRIAQYMQLITQVAKGAIPVFIPALLTHIRELGFIRLAGIVDRAGEGGTVFEEGVVGAVVGEAIAICQATIQRRATFNQKKS